MTPRSPDTDWNEIQFLSWREFRQMAPPILQLEIARLDRMIGALPEDVDFRNALVRARFELRRFVSCIGRAGKDGVEESCAPHLRTAIMNLSVEPTGLDLRTRDACRYVLDRLNYVHQRLHLIY